jgi:hypothetical protein
MQDEDSKDLDDVTSDTPLEEIIMSKVHQGNHGSGRDVVSGDSIGPWRRLVRYVKSSTAALWQNLIARCELPQGRCTQQFAVNLVCECFQAGYISQFAGVRHVQYPRLGALGFRNIHVCARNEVVVPPGNAEYMAVPGRHVDKEHKTLHNFCGGYLTNLVYQDVIMNGDGRV